MSKRREEKTDNFTTTTGHALSESAWLDRHFATAQPEYEAMLRAVGFHQGWNVLDAGCGSGSFIPLMSELIGETGQITAIDLAKENIDRVNARMADEGFNCPVDTEVSSVTSLMYPDNHFDAVWCGAVAQYLSDTELESMLSEFKRVVRSGGVVAIKDFDLTIHQWYPSDPTFIWRIYEPIREKHAQARGLLRTINLRKWLLQAGFVDVNYTTTIVHRVPPLKPVEREFITDSIQFTARLGVEYKASESDLRICQNVLDDDKLCDLMKQPEFFYREGHALVVARTQ